MKIKLHEIPVRDVVAGYIDSAENGVRSYNGKLNIRPAFQREFIYKDKQRDEVIQTVMKQFPLNVMYWVQSDDGNFEVLDGQQRTISICQYVTSGFSVVVDGMPRNFDNLTTAEQNQILDYHLMIYICEGTDKEKLDWFKIINIAGEELTNQELRNAIYTGEWLAEAKKYFSKNGCAAHAIGSKYLSGSAIRQNYLETAIKWIADRDKVVDTTDSKDNVAAYMGIHQHDTSCSDIWLYFKNVVNWIEVVFPKWRKEMQGLDWGIFYNKYGKKSYDPKQLEDRIVELMEDDDVSKKSGVYEYLLDGNEKHLSIRAFSQSMKRAAYERQNGICVKCGKHFELDQMQADHITPWSKGGKTTSDNCQMLCADCNRKKSDT